MSAEKKPVVVVKLHSALSRTCWKKAPVVYPKSDVDSSFNEPMERLVQRHLKGEVTPRFTPQYLKEGTDPEAAIAGMDPTRRPGFDLADASEAMRRGRVALDAVREARKMKAEKEKAEAEAKGKGVKEKAPPAKEAQSPAADAGAAGTEAKAEEK